MESNNYTDILRLLHNSLHTYSQLFHLVRISLYKIHGSARVSSVILLTLGQQSLQSLDVLPLRLVIQDVSHVFGEDPLSARPSVNAGIGHTDRPGGVTLGLETLYLDFGIGIIRQSVVTYGHLEVLVVGVYVVSLQGELDNLGQ